MAFSKEDYVALGREDAKDGLNTNTMRRPKAPAPGSTPTWQYRAYMEGFQAQCDENAVPKPKLIEAFKRGMAQESRKVWRDIAKAQAAFFKRQAQRERLQACDKALNRELASRRRVEFLGPNIRRWG